jgi:hypothetical protein
MTVPSTTPTRARRTAAQTTAVVVGVVFLVVGVAGFIPGLTTNFDTITFAGHHSNALLLGVFQVSVLHNIVHLLFGVTGIALARTHRGARSYLIGGGAIYLLLLVYGLIVDHGSEANFVPLNTADNWLHLGLGIGMIALGLILGRHPNRAATTDRTGAP